jgi:hypothetical protein
VESDKDKADKWVHAYVRNSNDHPILTDSLKASVKKYYAPSHDKYTLYRGLTWAKNDTRAMDVMNMKFGQQLSLSLHSYTSWSMSPKRAFIYANEVIMGSKGNDFGIIFELKVDKNDILADLTRFTRFKYNQKANLATDLKKIADINNDIKAWDSKRTIPEYLPYMSDQDEVLLDPGNYEVKVVFLRTEKVKSYYDNHDKS